MVMKKIILSILCIATMFSATSCLNKLKKHSHEWTTYLIKTPTCTQKGLLEKLCEECGEKVYEDIESVAHTFQNGVCTVCGTSASSNTTLTHIPLSLNENNEASLSLPQIYNVACSLNLYKGDSYTDFLYELSNGLLDQIYIDNLGLLHFTVSAKDLNENYLELPISYIIGKVSPKNPETSKFGHLHSLSMENNELVLTYNDGLRVVAGFLDHPTKLHITAFGMNENNEFVIYYSDNTIAFAGTILLGSAPTNQSKFTYQLYQNGYAIFNVIDNTKVIILPPSHRGKPIVYIAEHAFENCSAESIVIPETITAIHSNAFSGMMFPTTVYFEGSRNAYPNFANAENFYFKGEWSYINGVPTPNR